MASSSSAPSSSVPAEITTANTKTTTSSRRTLQQSQSQSQANVQQQQQQQQQLPYRTQQQIEHEAFRNKLVEDVLGENSNDRVPMDKVVMLIWQFRDDPSVVSFMARFMAKYSGMRHVLDGIEFYLPQLAHMIIHLEVEWDDDILERFALILAQQSIHFALQLNWILQGALEDYQPENDDGSPNLNYNRLFYIRCLKLLKNAERSVVYGKPRAAALQRLYEQGKISKQELILMEQADRRFVALKLTTDEADENLLKNDIDVDGWLYIQMPTSFTKKVSISSSSHVIVTPELTTNENGKDTIAPESTTTTTTTPPTAASESVPVAVPPTATATAQPSTPLGEFVQCWCVLDRCVLNVYSQSGSCASGTELKLVRAMSIKNAIIEPDITSKGTTIIITTPRYVFRLRCNSKEEYNLWLRRLREEAFQGLLFAQKNDTNTTSTTTTQSPDATLGDTTTTTTTITSKPLSTTTLRNDLTPAQLDRYNFFDNERQFVNSLTQLAEDLRFHDRTERKKLAPEFVKQLIIPEPVYLPLCNSSDIWRRVAIPVPEETRVFNTKARCPVILNFVSKRGEIYKRGNMGYMDPNLDVAEYMHTYFEIAPEMEGVTEGEAGEENEEPTALSSPGPSSANKANSTTGDDNNDDGVVSGSGVWAHEDDDEPTTPKEMEAVQGTARRGNRRVQQLLRESVVTLPSKLAKRLPSRNKSIRGAGVVSVMDRQTKMQPIVPILELSSKGGVADSDCASVGDGSVVSIGRSSVLVKDRIVYGAVEEGDIDIESIDRAKKYVTGGLIWAEKSAEMLEKARKQIQDAGQDDNSQLEIAHCISKSNDDLRQEVFVMQMIHYYKSVFAQAKLPLWLKTYRILSCSSATGLIEVLTDATSLDGLKKSEGYPYENGGLRKYFEMVYGPPDSSSFIAAQRNFMHSLAAYGLVSYLLGLKDRHNGNIMIDTRGHLIFIDFGFAMGMAPGHEFSMERAPFKLTNEYVELMGGTQSQCYKEFEQLFVDGFIECRKNSQIALGLIEIMMYKSNYPCFSGWRYGNGKALVGFEKRLMLRVDDSKIRSRALRLVRKARGHFGTYLYDVFQQKSNGYAI